MKRRALIKALSVAPLAAAPFNADAALLSNATPGIFVYDARLPAARAAAAAAAKFGHSLHAIQGDENGFWHSEKQLDFNAARRILGATTRRAFFVFDQLSRLCWSLRLTQAHVIHDDNDLTLWVLDFDTAS